MKLAFLFFIVVVGFSASLPAMDKHVFAVKGGISQGSYEAGLNWVHIERLRQLRLNDIAELDTFVGASAGSINSLLSAVRYCQKDTVSLINSRNLFQKTWDVGINDFLDTTDQSLIEPSPQTPLKLIDNSLLSNDHEGVFSRKGLRRSLQFLTQQITLSEGNFREGCQLKIGIAVTKLIPDSTNVAGIDVLNQRYIIPLLVSVQNGKLMFSNLQPENPVFTRQDNYIYLPEHKHEHKPVVDLHNVLNAILASSAFPVTFSPIEMNYCKAVTDSSLPSANCPAGYSAHQDSFIDGGNFDNAPIGAAMRINDVEGFYEDANIVFVNPGKRRNRERKLKAETQSQYENSQLLPGIKEYLGLSYHIFDYGMSAELYQTARRVEQLQRQSNSSRPSINVTDRYYPIVGGYLMHFGAFFDRAFREYDFIVGVYDGVVGIAESECKSRVKTLNRSDYYDCVGIEAKKVFAHVELNADNEISLFEKLARREFGAAVDSLAWAWLLDINRPISKKKSRTENNPLLSVFYSISRNHCSSNTVIDQCADPIKEKYFDQFLINLKHQDPALAGFEEHTRQVVNGESEWKHSLLDTAVNRLYAIERKKYKQAKDEKDPFLAQKNVFDILKMSTYVGKTYFLKNSTGLWPNSTKDSSRFSASKMLPDEIGISYRQTSVYLKYKTEIKIADLNIIDEHLPMGFETRFMPIDWASRTTKANKMLGAEFVLKAHISNPLISTLGFGYGYYNVDFFGHSPDGKLNSFTTPLHGAIIDLGAVAGKIKVSFIYRGSEINADNRGYVNWAVNLGLSDVKGLLWLW